MIFIEFYHLLYFFRGEEVVLALDFVRGMDEEELQHIFDQAEVWLNKGVMFFLITISTSPGSWLEKGNGRNWSDVW